MRVLSQRDMLGQTKKQNDTILSGQIIVKCATALENGEEIHLRVAGEPAIINRKGESKVCELDHKAPALVLADEKVGGFDISIWNSFRLP
ncbi:hypothetical protein HYQ46_007400 [Verticillium longisporum]|nr:hypothetical protein HYQ46_007400 [Verticillium longisporum]